MTEHHGGEQRPIKEVLETAPLYVSVPVARPSTVRDTFPAAIDVFCWSCRTDRCFSRWDDRTAMDADAVEASRPYVGTYICRQCQSELVLIVEFGEGMGKYGNCSIRKIGQRPALIECTRSQYNEYTDYISSDDCYELSRAVGLLGHGVGVGSYIYLRRIMERLISDAHEKAAALPDWDEQAYADAAELHQKLPLLRGQLPEFLVEQADVWSVLSKDLLEIEEQECLQYFPVLRLAIEAILDQRVAEAELAAKANEAKERLAQLQGALDGVPGAPDSERVD